MRDWRYLKIKHKISLLKGHSWLWPCFNEKCWSWIILKDRLHLLSEHVFCWVMSRSHDGAWVNVIDWSGWLLSRSDELLCVPEVVCVCEAVCVHERGVSQKWYVFYLCGFTVGWSSATSPSISKSTFRVASQWQRMILASVTFSLSYWNHLVTLQLAVDIWFSDSTRLFDGLSSLLAIGSLYSTHWALPLYVCSQSPGPHIGHKVLVLMDLIEDPSREERLKKFMSRVGGVDHNLTSMLHSQYLYRFSRGQFLEVQILVRR